ncbi:XRE family transcriptional regulator [Mesorhizobium ciceri]|uniref:hypothetical protein n=1 Tax=Mesorhizobium TaxID=68287 RepID=UPI0007A93FC8|nr:hypothetical protein [Mesorhizobium ciceri]AMX98779.1 DNA-binding protein [Mesorhizobium ciceri biovar biserrulae]
MTYEEFQRHVGKAGLTLKGFAELIRMNRVSVSNLAKKGEVPSHLAVIACLLGEMAERKVDFRALLAELDIDPKKPRGAAVKGRFGGSRQPDLFIERQKGVALPPKGLGDSGGT